MPIGIHSNRTSPNWECHDDSPNTWKDPSLWVILCRSKQASKLHRSPLLELAPDNSKQANGKRNMQGWCKMAASADRSPATSGGIELVCKGHVHTWIFTSMMVEGKELVLWAMPIVLSVLDNQVLNNKAFTEIIDTRTGAEQNFCVMQLASETGSTERENVSAQVPGQHVRVDNNWWF